MKITGEQVKYPILLYITQTILSIFILIALSRIIYVIVHYAFNLEMSWYFIKDIRYIGIISSVVLISGFILEDFLSKLKK